MARKTRQVQRTRKLTPEEATKYRQIREQVAEEMPEILARRRQARQHGQPTGPADLDDLVELEQAVRALKSVRESQGLSLADVFERSGISRSALCRMENGQDINPTINTLTRYARAVGKKFVISLADAD